MSYNIVPVYNPDTGTNAEQNRLNQACRLLKSNHEILDYKLTNRVQSIDYSIGLKDIYVPYNQDGKLEYANINDILGYPRINCSYPGLNLFDSHNSSLFLPYFERSIIRSIRSLLIDVIHKDTEKEQAAIDVFSNGSVNWDNLLQYYNLITVKLEYLFERYHNQPDKSYKTEFILKQKTHDDQVTWRYFNNQPMRPMLVKDVANWGKYDTEENARRMASQSNDSHVSKVLKYDCGERVAYFLYYCEMMTANG